MRKKDNTDYYINRHSCFLLQYHILMEADTTTSPAELANVLKTQTARKARKLYGETILKKYYWRPYFWSDSYFISSVSENSLHTIKQYIRNQGKR